MNFFEDVKKKVTDLFKDKTYYTIKGKKLYEEKILGEGGFGYVYLVVDENNNKYALKKINIQDKTQLDSVKREISYWNAVNNHSNIIKLIAYELTDYMALILMEYSEDGSLFNLISSYLQNDKNLKETDVLSILKQIVTGLTHIHNTKIEGKTIQHRDIKIENILRIGNLYKICDFGSCSTETIDLSINNKSLIKSHFSIFEKTTTFIYRPPEMIDEYSKFLVNEKVDVWMLGCVLYTMLFKKHPFMDADRCTIINSFYFFPDSTNNIYSDKIQDLVRLCLTQNPQERPSSKDILNILNNWNNAVINLPKSCLEIKKKQMESDEVKKKSNSYEPISMDELKKAQESILKKHKSKYKDSNKGNFYNKFHLDDVRELADELNDLYKDDLNKNTRQNNSNYNNQIPNMNYSKNNEKQNISKNNDFDNLFKDSKNFIGKLNLYIGNKKDEDEDDFQGFIFGGSNSNKITNKSNEGVNFDVNKNKMVENSKNDFPFDDFGNVFGFNSNVNSIPNNNNNKNVNSSNNLNENHIIQNKSKNNDLTEIDFFATTNTNSGNYNQNNSSNKNNIVINNNKNKSEVNSNSINNSSNSNSNVVTNTNEINKDIYSFFD